MNPMSPMGIDPVISQILSMSSPVQGAPQNIAQPAQAFTWGAGGSRMTPEDLARRRALSDQQMQGDYSPVQHWTQGLGRVVDGVLGALESNKLDKQSSQMQAADHAQIVAALGADSDLAPLLTKGNPAASIVDNLISQRHPKAAAPHYWETNDGSLGVADQNGPRILYQDPTAKITTIAVDNGDNTKTLYRVGPDGKVLGSDLQGGGGQASTAGASIPTGSPLSGPANSKVIQGPNGPMQVWNVGGEWYDNPEGL